MGTATMKTRAKKPFYLQTANPISHICMSPLPIPAQGESIPADNSLVHGPYVIFPLIASLVWLAGLLALVGLWVTDGRPQYSRGASAAIVFISDVGGAHKVSHTVKPGVVGVQSSAETSWNVWLTWY